MDIVERLRQRIGLVKFDSDAIALRDAADTIEQLRGYAANGIVVAKATADVGFRQFGVHGRLQRLHV